MVRHKPSSEISIDGIASDYLGSAETNDSAINFLSRTYRLTALFAILGVIAARVAGADWLAINYFVGVVIGLVMLYTTARLVRRYMMPSEQLKKNRIRLLLLLFAKLPILGIVLFFVTRTEWFQPIGLLLGLSMTLFVLTLCGLIFFLKKNVPEKRQ